MGGVTSERGRQREREGVRAILGQALAHLCLALPGLALYLIVMPRIYGFSTLGRLLDLFAMAIPFVLSVSFLAQFVSLWFKRRETAVLLFIACSLPALFHGRRVLACRGDPGCHPRGQPRVPEHLRDRWPGSHQPDGSEPARRLKRLGVPLGSWLAIYGALAMSAALVFRRREVSHGR